MTSAVMSVKESSKLLYNEILSENRRLKLIKYDDKIMCYIEPIKESSKIYGVTMQLQEFMQFLEFVDDVYDRNLYHETILTLRDDFILVAASLEYKENYVIDVRVKYFCARPDILKFLPTKHGFRLYKENIDKLLANKKYLISRVRDKEPADEVENLGIDIEKPNDENITENETPKQNIAGSETPKQIVAGNKIPKENIDKIRKVEFNPPRKLKRKNTEFPPLKTKKRLSYTPLEGESEFMVPPFTQEMLPIFECSSDEEY